MVKLNVLILMLSITAVTSISGSQPTADTCRPFVNTKSIPKMAIGFDEEIACLKNGHKKAILYDEKQDLNHSKKTELQNAQLLLIPVPRFKTEDPFRYIISQQNMQTNALIFKKYLLENALKSHLNDNLFCGFSHIDSYSAYGLGMLLGYSEEDITLFYQRRALNDFIVRNKNQQFVDAQKKQEIEKALYDPNKIKQFATSEDTLKKLWEDDLTNNKASFVAWYAKNNNLSVERLISINTQLEDIIRQSAQESKSKEKPKSTVPWWKKRGGYLAAFAASAAAAYAYFTGTKNTTP